MLIVFKKIFTNWYVIGLILFLGCLAVQMYWLAAFFPAAMTNDSISMWKQSIQGNGYGNLQPYLYTWFLYLTRRIVDSPVIIAGIQVTISAALAAGASVFMLRRSANKWLVACGYLAFVFSIPIMITNTIVHRDSIYAGLVLLLSFILVGIFFKDKELTLTRKIALGLFLALVASMRYDGAIYIVLLPAMLYFFKLMDKKGIAMIFATALLGYLFVQLPLANMLGVRNDRYLQIYNLETKLIGATYQNHPESFTPSELQLMVRLAPLELWAQYDATDDHNYWEYYDKTPLKEPEIRKQLDQLLLSKVLADPIGIVKDRYYMTLGLLRGEKINGPGIVKNEIKMRQESLLTERSMGKLGHLFSDSYLDYRARFILWSPLYLIIHAVFLVLAIIKSKKYLIAYICIGLASFLVIIPIVTSGQFRYMYPLFYSSFFVPALYTLNNKKSSVIPARELESSPLP